MLKGLFHRVLVLFPISPFHPYPIFCQAQYGVRSNPGRSASTSIQPDRKRLGKDKPGTFRKKKDLRIKGKGRRKDFLLPYEMILVTYV